MQKCPICLEPLTSDSTNHNVTTTCGHLFHINCVQDWLTRGISTCPKCLSNISQDKRIRNYLEPSESDVQIRQETDENQQRSESSKWSKIANSVAHFSEANSVSLISLSNSTGADNENSNTEPTTTNPTTSNLETIAPSNPETTQTRCNICKYDFGNKEYLMHHLKSKIHLERANTKKADGELSNPETKRSNPRRALLRAMLGDQPTNNEPYNCSDKQFLCCFCFLFVCFVLIFVLIICQIFS